MTTTTNVMRSTGSYLTRLLVIMSPIVVGEYLPNIFLYACSAFLIGLVGYDFVLEEGYGLTPFVASVVGTMYAVTTYLAQSFFWFNFYGVEYILVFVVGSIVWLIGTMVSNLVIGSIVFGNLGSYLNYMKREHTDNHSDPFGDKHAQKILNE